MTQHCPGKVYVVGGAVRDHLLGRHVSDIDYVVVGATSEQMIEAGFKQVGLDFPVFLDQKGNEFALARTERKVGPGYRGFVAEIDNVTLEGDLLRRDLTINAMAVPVESWNRGEVLDNLIDPYGGFVDLSRGILRPVSSAFMEDPVRLFRAARFAAKYQFTASEQLNGMCTVLANSGELDHLTPERVGMELIKVLNTSKPSLFFKYLSNWGALAKWFPELEALKGQTQPVKHHPEGDAFVHVMEVVDVTAASGQTAVVVFCSLVHDLGKGLSPKDNLPHHYGHEKAGVPLVEAMVDRLKLPASYAKLGKVVAEYHTHIHNLYKMKPLTIARLWLGPLRKVSTTASVLAHVALFDSLGRGHVYRNRVYTNKDAFLYICSKLDEVQFPDFASVEWVKTASDQQIKQVVEQYYSNVVKQALETFDPN